MAVATPPPAPAADRSWFGRRAEAGDLRLVFDPVDADREAAARCESDVFGERYGESRQLLDAFFAPHEAATTWLALVDAGGTAVASARLVLPSADPLNFDVCLSGAPWGMDPATAFAACGIDRGTTWDVASISVRRRSRGSGALWTAALCHGLFQVARENDVSATVAVLNEPARDLLDASGIVYATVPGASTRPFLGSPASTPVYAEMAALVSNQRRHFPEAHRLITLGSGLEGIQVPPAEGFRLRPRRSVDLRGSSSVSLRPRSLSGSWAG